VIVVNQAPPPESDPRLGAGEILRILGLPSDDAEVRRRVGTFIVCNGYAGVHEAARYTARRKASHKITEPWGYTVRVYNGNIARLSTLYVLTHLAESGLRSQADVAYRATNGSTWHRFPDTYLTGREVNAFQQETKNLLTWEQRPGQRGMQVVRPDEPAAFLELVAMGWLKQIVLNAHGRNARSILVHPKDGITQGAQARHLLQAVVDTRNNVAHNRLVRNEEYSAAIRDLLPLLHTLQFDTAKTLDNIEGERRKHMDALLQALRKPTM